jgi:hypothetical protein
MASAASSIRSSSSSSSARSTYRAAAVARVGIRGEPKRPLELRDRLPVRRQRGRRARRRGRVPQHRRDVVCFLGVKGHLRLV